MIRRAAMKDLEEILALQKLAYQSEAAIYEDYDMAPMKQTLPQIKEDFINQVFLKEERDSRIIGSVRAYEKDGVCHIGRLIVHPAYANKGVGTALLYAMEEQFALCGTYRLFTGHKSAKNLQFYQSRGYREVSREKINEKLTLVYLEKKRRKTISGGGERRDD